MQPINFSNQPNNFIYIVVKLTTIVNDKMTTFLRCFHITAISLYAARVSPVKKNFILTIISYGDNSKTVSFKGFVIFFIFLFTSPS